MNFVNQQKGFTLMETLVSLGIFLLAIAAVYVFIQQGFQVQNFSLEQTIAIQETRRGVEVMVREIREIQTADTGAFPVQLADDQEFIFFSDFDKDEQVEKVRYFLNGSDFNKGVTEPSGNPLEYLSENEQVETLSHYVRNGTSTVFTYYNGDWPEDTANNPLTTPANVAEVRLVDVRLQINVRPKVAPADFILQSDVQVRNLKDNL